MVIQTIICPVDFSELTERELELARPICDVFGARLVLHHNVSAVAPGLSRAWEWDQLHRDDEPSDTETERQMRQLLRRLPPSLRAQAVITHGPRAATVLALAEQVSADLLVVGAHGWSTPDHCSVTEEILARAPCSVLTLRDADALQTFRLQPAAGEASVPIVVATDFSPAADRALAYAAELARQLPLELHLLHVQPAPGDEATLLTMAASVPADMKDRAQCHLRSGDVLAETDALLRQLRPGLLMMGTHARDFWHRLFTRDRASQLLHGARCPVWFVPPVRA